MVIKFKKSEINTSMYYTGFKSTAVHNELCPQEAYDFHGYTVCKQ
jgi:hypothetical protein